MRILALLGVAASAFAQSPEWRKVGGSAVELALAAPATGPVDGVWFSADGSTLFARTRSGKIFQTADYDTWVPVQFAIEPVAYRTAVPVRMPEAGARILANPARPARIYALGRNLFRSDDGGRTWANLTAYRSAAVVGGGQHSVAVSPLDADWIVVANEFGVWRSLDGGLSWSGLNQFLPNLTVRRIVTTPSGAAGTRVQADGMGVLELPPGGSVWTPVAGVQPDPDFGLRQVYSSVVGARVTAIGSAGEIVYAGGAEGRLWVSVDGGRSFGLPSRVPQGTAGTVERIYVDPVEPWVALAALSGRGPHVLRTTSRGNFWDSLSDGLPEASARAVTAERAAGAVYVATDQGVYWATADLENASVAPVVWTSLSQNLPMAPATDVRLDAAGIQLYAALEGYGVYALAAPHLQNNPRIVNTGDYSTRPAAPGSLLSIIGGGRLAAVRGGNLNYPVLATSESGSQIQVPFEAAGPRVALSLQTMGRTLRRELQVQPVSPVIMVGRDGAPMLWDAETGMQLEVRNGARMNARLQVWATGLGKVTPEWPTGMQAPMENPPAVVAQVKAYLDGVALPVTRATMVPGFIGFYLIEVQLPAVWNAGQSELWISADGTESNHVPLAIEQ